MNLTPTMREMLRLYGRRLQQIGDDTITDPAVTPVLRECALYLTGLVRAVGPPVAEPPTCTVEEAELLRAWRAFIQQECGR